MNTVTEKMDELGMLMEEYESKLNSLKREYDKRFFDCRCAWDEENGEYKMLASDVLRVNLWLEKTRTKIDSDYWASVKRIVEDGGILEERTGK